MSHWKVLWNFYIHREDCQWWATSRKQRRQCIFWGNSSVSLSTNLLFLAFWITWCPSYWDFLGLYRVNGLTSHGVMNVQPKRAGFSYPDTTDWIPLSAFQPPSTLTTLSPNCFHSCSVILVYLEFAVTAMSIPHSPSWSLGLHPCPFTVCGGGGGQS